MPQLFVCQTPGTRFPFRARNINTTTTCLIVVSAVSYGAIGVSFAPGASGIGKSIYDGAKTFDTTAFSWLVMAQAGTNHPVLMKELDFPLNVETLLGSWALLARVADGQVYKIPQV